MLNAYQGIEGHLTCPAPLTMPTHDGSTVCDRYEGNWVNKRKEGYADGRGIIYESNFLR